MLRKCKVGRNHDRPAFFHGWFQAGNDKDGLDPVAVVEYEDGATDSYNAGYIKFENPPTADTLEGANLHHTTAQV